MHRFLINQPRRVRQVTRVDTVTVRCRFCTRRMPESWTITRRSGFLNRSMRKNRATDPFLRRNFLTNRQAAIYKPCLRSRDLPTSREEGGSFSLYGVTIERGSSNVEPEGALRGDFLLAGMSVQPPPAWSGDRKFFRHRFRQLRRSSDQRQSDRHRPSHEPFARSDNRR